MTAREIPFTTVDAFTSKPFGGNPAAVIVWDDAALAADDQLAQQIAAEFNLSETAFSHRLQGGSDDNPTYELRWRTPTTEVPLCGHATMATAHTLFTQHHPSATSITFQSRFSGTLIARRAGTGPNEPIALDFPAAPLVTLEEGHRRRPKILEGVAKAVKGFEESQVVRVAWWDGHKAPIVELAAGTDLENLQITPAPLADIGDLIMLTCPAPADSGFDIYSRVFAPAFGVPEDPVTGAAHTALTPFWLCDDGSLSRLHDGGARAKSTASLRAKQVSKRGGELVVTLDEQNKRVELKGTARRIMKGVIEL
ncbi:hypothetical protein C6P46_004773 [Rhodotorula mucilaginosa]|uniref:Phenazine biosynthesis PhzC/PhzF protein n=1 Tax=Rhodotorula mucilaginosa TaxID=5537 RepID=A0A9P7B4Z9_RHOMI|nr:hypothetical protein C6P46_004773 [Rhodotorula mucilaginosa]TKA50231.1 hypothetical protein B0A53_06331 [Rhodotorula sp. CCFEE 5036]